MTEAREISFEELGRVAGELGIALPIEQTQVWADYQATIDGRTPWGCVELVRDGSPIALMSLLDYETHGYHYLRSTHGPVWTAAPSEAEEAEACEALAAYVHGRDRHVAFIRMGVRSELDCCRPVLSTCPYNQTVVIDITGTPDDILARMKGRGRRDVRKSLRECQAEFADETERATADFSEYYDVMTETASRDGFAPAPASDYEDMLRLLGPEHCRLFAGRIDGAVVTWTIATINGPRAVRYYGASRSDASRALATDGLIYFECCALGERGCESYDQMGIGNDFAPTLMGLNTFKTKFSKDVVDVAPDRDLPVRKTFYKSLELAKRLRDRTR